MFKMQPILLYIKQEVTLVLQASLPRRRAELLQDAQRLPEHAGSGASPDLLSSKPVHTQTESSVSHLVRCFITMCRWRVCV